MQPNNEKQPYEKESIDRDGSDKSPITLFLSKVSQRLPTKSNVLARIKETLQQNQPYYEPWFEDKMKLCFLIRNKRCLPSGGNDKKFLARYLGQHFSYNQMYKSWEITNGYHTWYKRNINYEGDDLGLSKEHLLYFRSALHQERYNVNDDDDDHIPDPSCITTVSTHSANVIPQTAEMENIVSTHSSPLNKHKRHHSQSDTNTGKRRRKYRSIGQRKRRSKPSAAGSNQHDRIKEKSKKLVTLPINWFNTLKGDDVWDNLDQRLKFHHN